MSERTYTLRTAWGSWPGLTLAQCEEKAAEIMADDPEAAPYMEPEGVADRRPSLRRGLPYGWWKNRDFWVTLICLFMFIAMLFILVSAWYFDWKPVM